MELKEFIEETIVQIFEGVQSAQPKAKELGGTVNPFDKDYTDIDGKFIYSEYSDKRFIDFEVCLTKSENKEGKASLGVLFGGIGGSLSVKKGTDNSLVNKVKFSIPVFYPVNKTI